MIPRCRPHNPEEQAPRFRLLPVRSPLLGQSHLLSLPGYLDVSVPLVPLANGDDKSLHLPGYPIRKSVDQSVLAAPYRVSSLGTSFFGTSPQGIRQKPCVALEPLRSRAHVRPRSTSSPHPHASRKKGGDQGLEANSSRRRRREPCCGATPSQFILVACPKKTHSLTLLYFPLFRCKGAASDIFCVPALMFA